VDDGQGPSGSGASSEASVPKVKKKKAPYNLKAQIRGALRNVWRFHPVLQEVLRRDRIERPYVKVDGSVSRVPRVFFRCYVCNTEHSRKNIDIDHRIPVGDTPGSALAAPGLTWDMFIDRLFCPASNLACICKPCHKEKSNRETAERFRRLAAIKGVKE
jgi:hypothetical protein